MDLLLKISLSPRDGLRLLTTAGCMVCGKAGEVEASMLSCGYSAREAACLCECNTLHHITMPRYCGPLECGPAEDAARTMSSASRSSRRSWALTRRC